MLFLEEICNWQDWGRVFQSIPAFERLIAEIFHREGLPPPHVISHLTPGTNAVFRVDERVVKIFFPKESGMNPKGDYDAERAGIHRALTLHMDTPCLRGEGFLDDKYRFYYLITDYWDGVAAGEYLKKAGKAEREAFVRWLKDGLSRWNTPVSGIPFRNNAPRDSFLNSRFQKFSQAEELWRREYIETSAFGELAAAHGDLTADNLLVLPDGSPVALDFADSVIAPPEYELPPILFDLFNFDVELAALFRGDEEPELFAERVFRGLVIHDFGADFTSLICKRFLDAEAKELKNLEPVRAWIHAFFR